MVELVRQPGTTAASVTRDLHLTETRGAALTLAARASRCLPRAAPYRQ